MSEQDELPSSVSAAATDHTNASASRHPDASPEVTGENTVPTIIGWREWVSLPELGLPAIKAKVDTGARTSAVHAYDIKREKRHGQDWLLFSVQPIQRDSSIVRRCEAPLVDIRRVTDSGGHTDERYFISTQLQLGNLVRQIEVTLSQRDDMLFRMLLGRTAMVPGILVNPSESFSLGRLSARLLYADDATGTDS